MIVVLLLSVCRRQGPCLSSLPCTHVSSRPLSRQCVCSVVLLLLPRAGYSFSVLFSRCCRCSCFFFPGFSLSESLTASRPSLLRCSYFSFSPDELPYSISGLPLDPAHVPRVYSCLLQTLYTLQAARWTRSCLVPFFSPFPVSVPFAFFPRFLD